MFYMDAIIANEYPVEESMAKIISHMKKFEKRHLITVGLLKMINVNN